MATPSEPDYSISLDDFFAGKDTSELPTWSPSEISRLSVGAFNRQRFMPTVNPGSGQVRLTGGAVIGHAIPIDETSRILAALQKAVTFLGAAVDQRSPRPTITAALRRSTALLLTPQIAPGSVVLTVVSRQHEVPSADGTPEMIPILSPADNGVGALLELCRVATSDSPLPEGLNARLRELGPRAARMVLHLTNAVLDDDVELDMSWTTSTQRNVKGVLGRRQATTIRDTITVGRIEVERVVLVGILRTISQVVPLDLYLDGGNRIQLQASEAQRDGAAPLYNMRVTVEAEETIVMTAGGATRPRYEVNSIREYRPGDIASSQLYGDATVEPVIEYDRAVVAPEGGAGE